METDSATSESDSRLFEPVVSSLQAVSPVRDGGVPGTWDKPDATAKNLNVGLKDIR